MDVQLAYTFDCAQTANRFLNDIRSGTIKGVFSRFYRDSSTVMVSYSMDDNDGGFDSRTGDLDDLVRCYGGSEVPL